jgi:hypothetical protein
MKKVERVIEIPKVEYDYICEHCDSKHRSEYDINTCIWCGRDFCEDCNNYEIIYSEESKVSKFIIDMIEFKVNDNIEDVLCVGCIKRWLRSEGYRNLKELILSETEKSFDACAIGVDKVEK